MSNLNVNGNYESKIAQTGSTVSSTQTQQAKDPSSVFGKRERWEELGLTKEQYENLCAKDPAFGTKSLDEQKKVLAGLDVEVAAPAEEAQQSAHTSEAAGTVQANTTTETAKAATAQPTETQSVENKFATTAEITQAEPVEDETPPAPKILTKAEIDERKAFNKMGTEEKLSIIIEDYAQNSYMFGDADNRHKEKDWNALSSEAKQAEIEKSKQHLNRIIQKYASQTSEKGKVTDTETLLKYILQSNDKNSDTNKLVNNLLDSLHTDLEIAKQNEYSIKDFATEEPEIKDRLTYEYIDSIYKNSPNDAEEALSASDKHYFSKKNIELEAVKSYLIKEKGVKPDVSLCFDDITPEMLAERGIKDKKDLFKVTTTYFEEKTAEFNKMSDAQKASLTDAEKQSYEYMKGELAAREELTKTKLGQAYLYGKGEIQKPDPPSLLDKMLAEKEAGFEKFQISTQISVLSAALEKSSKNEEEYAKNLSACIQSAMADGKVELATTLMKLGMKKCPNSLESLLSSDAAFVTAVADQKEMTATQVKILAERGEKLDSKELRTTASNDLQINATSAQRVPLANVYINAKDQETREGVVTNIRNKAEDAKTQDEVDKIVREKGDIKTRGVAIDTIDQLKKEIQLKSLERHTNDSIPELLKIATHVPSRLEQSADAGKIVFGATQKVKDKKVRVEIQNSLADDVIKYKNAADQIAMHQTLMTSKDEAVLNHAANNIYKYQEAAQAKALDATKATGNTKAIDEAMKNYDKYSKSVQQEPKYKEMQRETEVRKTREIAEQVADFHAQYEKLTGQKLDVSSKASDTEIKMAYVKEFLNASPQEQFKMISKIPASWQTIVFSKMAQYCPQMLTGLVKQGYGKSILKTPGLSLDVISAVINVMLVQQNSDKKSAIKYVKAHKSMFSDATLEKVEELTAQDKPKKAQHSTMPAFGTVKGALRPVKSAIYPDTDQLDVYNA